MQISCYAIVVFLIVALWIYVYSGANVILTLSISIVVVILCGTHKFCFSVAIDGTSDFLKNKYKKVRLDMSNYNQNSKTSERNKNMLGSGLLSDYDSRLARSRVSLKLNSSISEQIAARSPNRTTSKLIRPHPDENFMSECTLSSTENEIPSPIRSGMSPFRSSPLSYSKRFNTNTRTSIQNSPGSQNNSRVSSLLENNSAKSLGSPNSFARRSLNSDDKYPSSFASRMISVANQMDSDQFPWVSHNGSIPMIYSSPHMTSNILTKINSPSADATSPFRNRVRVRLSKPNRSDVSAVNSSVDNSAELDESSTTKSVIQVLKEIARKRCLTTDDEEEQEGPPQAKRRTEHNLYLSRLEGEEEGEPVPVSLPQTRANGEDERTKRTRDPDWDTSNVSQPKRPRKNYNFVNNEIISSLSSSIGLQAFKHSQRRKSMRKSIAIQVQTLVPEENNEEKKEQSQSQPVHVPPKTRDTGMLTDPIPEPRPRSPVKKKEVSDVNGILKSALSKFDIQPSASTTIDSASITSSPLSNFTPNSPIATSAVSISTPSSTTLSSPFSLSNQTIPSSSNLGTTKSSSFSLTTAQNTLTPVSSPAIVTQTVPTPLTNFGLPSKSSFEISKPNIKEATHQEILPKPSEEPIGLKPESNKISLPESPFKFGTIQSDLNVKPSDSQLLTTIPGFFNVKDQQTSSSVQIPATSSSTFTFEAPKKQGPTNKTKVSEEPKNIFGPTTNVADTSLNGPVASVVTPATATSMFLSQKTESSALALTAPNSLELKNELPTSVPSGFSFLNKLTNSKEENKEATPGIFTFGKPETKPVSENNSLTVSKPFQFGSGGFTFGQTSKPIGDLPSSTVSQTISPISSVSTQPVFSFSSGSVKKDEKSSAFTFNASGTTTNEQKGLFSFNASTASTVTAPSSFGITSTAATTKPVLSNSLFGSALGNKTVTTNSGSGVTNTTFGSDASKPAAPTFSLSTTTSTAPTFGSNIASKSVFGSGSNPPSFGNTVNNAPVFGSNITKNETSKLPAFGSSNTGNLPAFGIGTPSTSSNASTFGSVAAGSNNTTAFGITASSRSNQPVFGATVTNTNNTQPFGNSTINNANVPTFGSGLTSGSTTTFGGITVGAANSSPFGASLAGPITAASPASSSLFGASSGTSTSAGSVNPPPFGASTTTNTVNPSPFSGASSGVTTATAANPSLFGVTSAGTTASGGANPSPFRGSSVFGGTGTNNNPSFGTTPTIGNSTSTFGSSSSSGFGSSSAIASPTFSNQPQQGFGNQAAPSFGSTSAFGQTHSSSTPNFGTQNTFGNQGTSTPVFGSSTNTFGTIPVPAATPAFGASTIPAFGSSTGFGSQETNKPFSFNPPASQPTQSGSFNFNAPAPQQQPQPQGSSSGGLFQFGNNTPGGPSNQPFQFNASQSSAPGFTAGFSPGVGGSGQQMFSIGSGSTAPRRMPARRKK